MEQAITFTTRSYTLLTKPGIILGNAITTIGGFALSSKGKFDSWLFLMTLAGLSLIIGSACVFNNYIDRERDAKMARTKNRALARGLIPPKNAILFGIFLGLGGIFLLGFYVNFLALGLALFGFFVYVFLYSLSKSHTIHATLVGSFAGATPPVVGYCAVTNCFDMGALLLFLMLAMWQMPHFFSIAIYRLKDYAKASIPVLPLEKGMLVTKVHMYFYIIAFIIASSLLTLFDYTGMVYLIIAVSLGLFWLCLCIQGFTCKNDIRWARKMFLFSLVTVTAISVVIPLSAYFENQ